ncbi:MAG: lysylphosphatidylglycerol synthase transmembrane domain-containing protein [Bacteroidales bacterium]
MKRFFNILFYLSIAVFIWYLTRIDYLEFSRIQMNYWYVGLAVAFLWAGFYLSTQSWWYALRIHNILISRRKALASHGLSVFAKYIPGKVWVILGRASYIAKDTPISGKDSSIVSLKEQLIYILWGLIISFFPLLRFDNAWYIPVLVFLTMAGIALFLFLKPLHNLISRLVKRWFKKELNIPLLTVKGALQISGYIIAYWIFWIAGFYLLLKGVDIDNAFLASFIFPISVVYGILAIIIPGGIGVREGIIVSLLTLMGCDLATATSFSILARLWFISGEVFVFLAALIYKPRKTRHHL